MDGQLFRPEALAAQRRSELGGIVIAVPPSLTLFAALFVAVAGALAARPQVELVEGAANAVECPGAGDLGLMGRPADRLRQGLQLRRKPAT